MRVAVIGGGVAGLTAAYYLARAHEVDLFDRNDWAGGHARTIGHTQSGHHLDLDIGFMVYNEASYPGFVALLRELGVETQPSDMSFSVSCAACSVEYSSRGLGGWLAQPSSALRPQMLRLGLDIRRFYSDAVASMHDQSLADATITDYLRLRRYSDTFRRHFIVPLMAAVWSTPPALIDTFPAQYFLRFIHNHGLVGTNEFRWRTVTGGSAAYVNKLLLASRIHCVLDMPVRSLSRCAGGVGLRLASGETRSYDKAVVACHADEALPLLEDADDSERDALGAFMYKANDVVLHTDASLLPAKPRARASWNYVTLDCRQGDTPLAMTYHLNRLQAIEAKEEFCVTLNPGDRVDQASIIHRARLSHPCYSFDALRAQAALSRISGRRHTLYAGAYLGYGFHEDGYQAGRRAAAMLGALE
jgi:predicted NAD/FAD-binding protein